MTKIKYLLFTIVFFAIFFIVSELGLRTYQKFVIGIPFNKSASDFHDPLLGWTGKKIFGNTDTTRTKIFVVGDSYTNGVGADETRMYYRVVAKALNAELFVYGGSGYGTAQEYLAIDHYLDEINPDLVILQTCSNDFINNSYELEKRSYHNNNLMVRPYFENDRMIYRYPRFLGGQRTFLIKHSRILYMFFNGIDLIKAGLAHQGKIKSIELKMDAQGLEFKPLAQSKDTTFQLIKRIKERVGHRALIATYAGGSSSQYQDYLQDIFSQLNIPFFTKPAQTINQLTQQGMNLSLEKNGHWNADGHQIFGKILLDEITAAINAGQITLAK